MRATLAGARREVLHLLADTLIPGKLSQLSHPSIGTAAIAAVGTDQRDSPSEHGGATVPGDCPAGCPADARNTVSGAVGTIGMVFGRWPTHDFDIGVKRTKSSPVGWTSAPVRRGSSSIPGSERGLVFADDTREKTAN